jgi:hypothetical protein
VLHRVGLSLRGMRSEITHTPFSLPISNILCQTYGMKNLTATICLTIAAIVIVVWLGWKLRVSWSRFRFWRSRRRGAKGERFAVDLLSKNGYEVLSTCSLRTDMRSSRPKFLWTAPSKAILCLWNSIHASTISWKKTASSSAFNTANTPLSILNQMSQILLWIRPLSVPFYMTTDNQRYSFRIQQKEK